MLWMAESKTHGCDAHSTRCTQLLIDSILAVERKWRTVYIHRRCFTLLDKEPRDLAQVNGHTRGWEAIPMGLSPSPTFANVYSNHEMDALGHEKLVKASGVPVDGEVIQNWSGWEGV